MLTAQLLLPFQVFLRLVWLLVLLRVLGSFLNTCFFYLFYFHLSCLHYQHLLCSVIVQFPALVQSEHTELDEAVESNESFSSSTLEDSVVLLQVWKSLGYTRPVNIKVLPVWLMGSLIISVASSDLVTAMVFSTATSPVQVLFYWHKTGVLFVSPIHQICCQL